jgi:ferrochelatase
MAMTSDTALIFSAHGTVDSVDQLPAFLQRIRRGRPTPQSIIDEVTHRYQTIGGSPLLRTSQALAALVGAQLGVPAFVGMRLWGPTLEEALTAARDAGARRVISLPLAPQSVHIYHESLREAAGRVEGAPSIVEVPSWGEEPLLLAAFNHVIDEAIGQLDPGARAGAALILSAHSLPMRVIAMGDPYEQQFRAMAAGVLAARTDAGRPTRVAFQSQGMDGGDWLGPDLPRTFAELAAAGVQDVVVASIGFTSDHVETLYDLDIEAPRLAEAAGLRRLVRARSLNTHPLFVDALAAIARRAM